MELNKKERSRNATTHGLSYTRLYRIWWSMNQRCHNLKIWNYKIYGARGITVCDEWRRKGGVEKFAKFVFSLGWHEKCGLDIDRINNELGYFPGNLRLVTRSVNLLNSRMLHSNNSSGYRGVCHYKNKNNFHVRIYVNKKCISIGYYPTAIDGAIARDRYILDNNVIGANLQVLNNDF